MHDRGEGSGERGVFLVAERLGDFTDAERGAEKALAGGGDLGVEDEALGRGAEVGPETALKGRDRHACEAGEFVDIENLVDVVVDVIDELGEGAVGGGEGVALSLVELEKNIVQRLRRQTNSPAAPTSRRTSDVGSGTS